MKNKNNLYDNFICDFSFLNDDHWRQTFDVINLSHNDKNFSAQLCLWFDKYSNEKSYTPTSINKYIDFEILKNDGLNKFKYSLFLLVYDNYDKYTMISDYDFINHSRSIKVIVKPFLFTISICILMYLKSKKVYNKENFIIFTYYPSKIVEEKIYISSYYNDFLSIIDIISYNKIFVLKINNLNSFIDWHILFNSLKFCTGLNNSEVNTIINFCKNIFCYRKGDINALFHHELNPLWDYIVYEIIFSYVFNTEKVIEIFNKYEITKDIFLFEDNIILILKDGNNIELFLNALKNLLFQEFKINISIKNDLIIEKKIINFFRVNSPMSLNWIKDLYNFLCNNVNVDLQEWELKTNTQLYYLLLHVNNINENEYIHFKAWINDSNLDKQILRKMLYLNPKLFINIFSFLDDKFSMKNDKNYLLKIVINIFESNLVDNFDLLFYYSLNRSFKKFEQLNGKYENNELNSFISFFNESHNDKLNLNTIQSIQKIDKYDCNIIYMIFMLKKILNVNKNISLMIAFLNSIYNNIHKHRKIICKNDFFPEEKFKFLANFRHNTPFIHSDQEKGYFKYYLKSDFNDVAIVVNECIDWIWENRINIINGKDKK